MTHLPRSYQFKADVRFRSVDGEGVVLRQEAGEVLVVNALGAEVLEALCAGGDLAEITDRLLADYDVDRETLTADVASYLQDLESRGVVMAAGANGGD